MTSEEVYGPFDGAVEVAGSISVPVPEVQVGSDALREGDAR